MKTIMIENRITLTRRQAGWMAKFEGPHAVEIEELFGTKEIPTPYTAQTNTATVLTAIRTKNPECIVVTDWLHDELRPRL